MTLDLLALSRQVEDSMLALRNAQEERRSAMGQALEKVSRWSDAVDELQAIANGRGRLPFSVASPREPWGGSVEAPDPLVDYAVIAADGSQIDRDRHAGFDCVLINIGSATLRYGKQAQADLTSQPTLLFRPEDLFIVDPQRPDRREPVSGALLHAKRNVMECAQLATLSQEIAGEEPLLCLIDNSLILWGLRRFEDWVRSALIEEYGKHLEHLRQVNENGKPVALAGYISRPDSSGVVNLLRLADCPDPNCVNCAAARPANYEACHELGRLHDRELFGALLPKPGDRSAIFDNPLRTEAGEVSPIAVSFFYFNTGEEIARIEVPTWVADSATLRPFTHAGLWAQARLGLGYPTALLEAHEQAVVGTADRELFWAMIESTSQAQRIPYTPSMKNQSKHLRAL